MVHKTHFTTFQDFIWTDLDKKFKVSSRINFASLETLEKLNNVTNRKVEFMLANIKTAYNEFSFRLLRKHEPASNDEKLIQQSYLVLESRAKVPSDQKWMFKTVNSDLAFVTNGNFLPNLPEVRIPENIVKKPFVDYELYVAKCSPMQEEAPNQVLILA